MQCYVDEGAIPMSDANERAEELARRLEEANAELISVVAGCPEGRWRAQCEDGGRTVAVVAHHVANGHVAIAEWVQSLAAGQPVSVAADTIHTANNQHAIEYANVAQEEVLELLRGNGPKAAAIVRGLTDEQLDRAAPLGIFGGKETTAYELAERVLIGHVTAHMRDIRAAIEK
jgi:uncharacterized damage-inducible protein DinB